MKSLKILLSMSVLAIASAAMAAPVSYSKTAVTGAATTWGTLKAESYDVAVRIDDATLRGSKVVGVKVPMATVAGLANPKAFVTTTLTTKKNDDGVRVNDANIETVDASFEGNYLVATFTNPATFTDTPLYVGFSFDIDVFSAENRTPLAGVAAVNDGGFFVRTSRSYASWVDKCATEKFTSSMTVLLEGDFTGNGAALRMDETVFCEQFKGFNVPVVYINQGTDPVSTIDFSWTFGEQTGTGKFVADSPIEMEFGREYPLTFYVDSSVEKGYKDLTITVDHINGKQNMHPDRSATREVRVVSRVPVRRPLVEEYTGTWCGFCTRGIASMEHMRNTLGDEFVGIAYHQNSSQPEPMAVVPVFPNTPPGLPKCVIDRTEMLDPYHGRAENGKLPNDYGFIRVFNEYKDKFSPCAISLSANWDETNTDYINIETEVVFVDPMNSNYGLEYIVSIDGVVGDKNDVYWLQKNLNQGMNTDIEEMRLFSSGGMYHSIVFNDVALLRSGTSPIVGSLPQNVVADTPYVHNYQMQVANIQGPTKYNVVENRNNIRVTAVVIDKTNNQAVNSAQTRIGKSNIQNVNSADLEVVNVEYYDMRGMRVTDPCNGMYVRVTRYNDASTKTEKILVK